MRGDKEKAGLVPELITEGYVTAKSQAVHLSEANGEALPDVSPVHVFY